ncbi:hypothetical protein [Ferrimonas balearica]|uniref:hypothetical protein n=1 Tax=Ferrimonas balearica TaxID=44012 RepID=UPI001C9A2576|nr:hypothetical protein [Ferrimonas balearica]MBY5920428.1 hypothetical protein [Ferrimonas balearica]MBY5996887.1 hypothetical protein [Ferrimonas balearica]
MAKPLPINCDFIQFLLSRSAPFLVRYASLADPDSWRLRVQEQQLPEWRRREQQADPSLSEDLVSFVELTFGAGRLPMLRRRYSTHLHRVSRQKKAVDLDLDALAALDKIRVQYKLDSYSETISWMVRELEDSEVE